MTSRPLSIAVVVGVGIEVLGLVAAAAWMAIQLLRGRADSVGTAVGLVVFALVFAGALALVTRSLVRTGTRPARATVVTWQLVQAGSAGTIIGAGVASPAVIATTWATAALAVVLVAVLVADAWRANRAAGLARVEPAMPKKPARPSRPTHT
ncbi:hypothetical protein Q6348_15160 [Isoptericola sp. b441]|uniref:Histidine kinase n=1 Tax=Actinotalea lenta TaxID=3064654 RepID=A0ABT9DD33_9CELL|nr:MULTISPECIES: hypothetical protein [unclassified Isoptericola]MDO8108535.1 hypothetical protein [Isoptericola sp. b441]MDO8119945.1 hypothetical protein [Isoptericola sp. b490]